MQKLPLDPAGLENTIGYSFRNKEYLTHALTHSSFSNEMGVKNHHLLCNERLEFLGDSVLSILTSEYLFAEYGDCPEGDLTRMRAEVVCEKALAHYAGQIGLGQYLRLGHGEEKNNGRERKSIQADAFEALLAAMYLDADEAGEDNKETVRRFLLPFVIHELTTLPMNGAAADYKTALQQFVQQSEGDLLEYVTVGESGPDHRKVFSVEARINSNVVGTGTGCKKSEAEQNAAKAALTLFGLLSE